MKDNISYFQSQSKSFNVAIKKSDSAIQILEFEKTKDMLKTNQLLFQSGFLVGSIRPPTVKTSRLRMTITASHNEQEIKSLVKCIADSLSQYGLNNE